MRKITFDDSKIRRFATKAGGYIAATACIAAVGIIAFGSFKSSNLSNLKPPSSQIESSVPQYNFYEQTQQVQQNTQDVPIEPSSQPHREESSSQRQEHTSTQQTYILPCDGQAINKYSDGELIFNEIMGDWRPHDGTDFACEREETVFSVADGIVKSVQNDVVLGICVEVEHEGGITVRYCGLEEDTIIRDEEQIIQGQPIGRISGVPCEANMGSHLHIEVMVDGRRVDPESYLGKTINIIE